MKYVRSHKILFFYGLIIFFGVIFNFISSLWFTSFDPNGLSIDAGSFVNGEETLSYRLLGKNEPQRITFSTHISEKDLSFSDKGNLAVMLFQLNGQAYSVYFNNEYLGSVGDIDKGCSNIWNSVRSFYFSKDIVKADNVLSIETLSLYDRGLSTMPVFVLPASDIGMYMCFANFFTEDINLLAIGFCVFACVIVLKLFLMSVPKNKSFLWFSLGILSLGLYLLDYTTLNYLPFDYLTYKKLIMGCLYLAISLASLGMFRFFHRWTSALLSVVTISGYTIGAILIGDMVTFKAFYSFYNLIIVFNLINWISNSIRHFKKSDEAKMFLIGNICLLLCALIDVYMTISGRLFSLTTPFTYAFIFSMTSVILFFKEFVTKDQQLRLVNDAHQESYLASITDIMTGLYNHRHLLDMLMNTPVPYTVAMIDIDDFKQINDTFGHRYGDNVIQFIAQYLSEGVRSTDIVFRYGGDEFFIIFPNCSTDNAQEVIKKIQGRFKDNPQYIDAQEISVTFSCGLYYVASVEDAASVFERVDHPLYKSKNEGKDRITVYDAAI